MFRDIIVFLAGAEFFHTLAHILLSFYVQLPLQMKFMELTRMLNIYAIIANGAITILLIWWASKLKRK